MRRARPPSPRSPFAHRCLPGWARFLRRPPLLTRGAPLPRVSIPRRTDEPVWPLPTEKRYRTQLDSTIADLKNVGSDHPGAITAALFLAEFVGSVPWAHLDIAGTMYADVDESWRSKGATGFGTRLLVDLALHFTPPASGI
jgi:leucyl aminopeptidase